MAVRLFPGMGAAEYYLVSHTHWDREWYRTFQAFRARLVDTVDKVLDLIADDPGYRFLLDGQSVILEDYLEIRPGRRGELEQAVRNGRISIGPWYVQPDSLMPSGEAHVRNLLEGRRVGSEIGPVSKTAYTPDSFGHPSQYPQIFSGFGLRSFVYWRGNDIEIDELPSEYRWVSPDGTGILACHLYKGYGNIASLPLDPREAVERITPVAKELSARTNWDRVLLMNGSDHLLPDPHTREVAIALARTSGARVVRGLLEDFVEGIGNDLPEFRGELLGARIAHLLPGVWSTRTYLKLRNRRCERLLEGWAEPWAALGRIFGVVDERPSLRAAWRSLLHNQAHDSICGCSQDAVHDQMLARYDISEELANETAQRVLERLAGLGPQRRVPWEESVDIAVFNPSPHTRTDVVRFPLDGYPPFGATDRLEIHPLLMHNLQPKGFTVDGAPARLMPAEGNRRLRLLPDQQDWEIEFVARDVPAFGYKLVRLAPGPPASDEIDSGREILSGSVFVSASDDGTFTVRLGDRIYSGIGGLEDTGDRGDTYDFDPVLGEWDVARVEIRRLRHTSGIQHLEVRRVLELPAGLTVDRSARSDDSVDVAVTTIARVAPGIERVDLSVRVENVAHDHRLRMLFPTGSPVAEFLAATTFDVTSRSTAPRDDSKWIHPAPRTFPSPGWVSVNGLTVVAQGLYESEVTAEGTIAITLCRSVGFLSRPDLTTRPGPAGPSLATPGAQCLGTTTAYLSLSRGITSTAARSEEWGLLVARDAELGLRSVAAGEQAILKPDISLLSLEPATVVLSAVKPAEEGDGIVVRMFNPTNEAVAAVLTAGFQVSEARGVRLDESVSGEDLILENQQVRLKVPPHAIRSVFLA